MVCHFYLFIKDPRRLLRPALRGSQRQLKSVHNSLHYVIGGAFRKAKYEIWHQFRSKKVRISSNKRTILFVQILSYWTKSMILFGQLLRSSQTGPLEQNTHG